MENKYLNRIILGLSAGILGCLLYVSLGDLTSKESSLLSILLTMLSFIASWLVSIHFSTKSHKQAIEEVKEQHLSNLKTYALNAAEKVSNLSNELGRLSVYLQEELEKDDGSVEEAYLSSFERIESSIHIINTLKSVNDTYLSDWKGVIGDELDEKLEEKQEREDELKDLVYRVEQIVKSNNEVKIQGDQNKNTLSKQISELRKELTLNLNSVSGAFVRTKSASKSLRQDIENKCPHCTVVQRYIQKTKENSYKTIKCSNCTKRSLARWYPDKGFVLEPEQQLTENVICPWCNEVESTALSSIPFTKNIEECSKCCGKMQISRTVKGLNVDKYGIIPSTLIQKINLVVTEEDIQKVHNKLPKQPWPTSIHKKIAEELGIEPKIVSLSIKELIKRDFFKPQIDGVLYERRIETNTQE